MKFEELDLSYELLDALDAMHFQECTPIQEQAIPIVLEGYDLRGCAQTGTGKRPPICSPSSTCWPTAAIRSIPSTA